jgi:hypothetical protein
MSRPLYCDAPGGPAAIVWRRPDFKIAVKPAMSPAASRPMTMNVLPAGFFAPGPIDVARF